MTRKERHLRRMPFTPAMFRQVVNFTKTLTTRTKSYGMRGDRFDIGGDAVIQLIDVKRVRLHVVADRFFEAEGFESASAFIAAWEKLHPRAGWRPDQKVYLHYFRVERRCT